MELDFDKEIDALLRKTRGNDPVFVVGAPHLEADEIAAFAENALPEKTRVFFTAHLADCDRCRKILTNTIAFNTEAAPEAAIVSAPAIIKPSEPWFRQLLLFPNLAYVMGALVLVFSAFLGYTVLRNSTGQYSSSVSQVAETESGPGGPSVGDENIFSGDIAANTTNAAPNTSANSAPAAANKIAEPVSVATNSNSAASVPVNERQDILAKNAPTGADKEVVLDGASASADTAAGAPLTQPAPKSAKDEDDALRKMKREAVTEEQKAVGATDSTTLNARSIEQLPMSGRGGPSKKAAGPSGDMSKQFPNRAENSFEAAVTRNVGGRKFERKDGVWYDSAYHGQATANYRRGTDAYRKLDGGIKNIANSLGGTVVVVSGGRAYRIQ